MLRYEGRGKAIDGDIAKSKHMEAKRRRRIRYLGIYYFTITDSPQANRHGRTTKSEPTDGYNIHNDIDINQGTRLC